MCREDAFIFKKAVPSKNMKGVGGCCSGQNLPSLERGPGEFESFLPQSEASLPQVAN